MAKADSKSTTNQKSGYEQKVVDDIDEEIAMARGIEAALQGLECLDKGMLAGVIQLQVFHIGRMEKLRARVSAEV